ncbi:isochorismatase family protein [Burkholderia pseudomultivorans]|uniref:isochorismatase family protein n=1 Tax=Burkholderia pseudomultivorans TaxID=1207504 RepID=UPI002875AA2A|nr:isochorismatase family protein [Burkholderia pseudomultivorans]MDS0856539.1 isochorismatase family protein [Burkholderia pseudomultivorans]
MLHVSDDSVLVLVDFQSRLMPVIHEGPSVVAQAVRLARIAQLLGVPVVGTEQSPLQLGRNVSDIKDLCSDTVVKDHFDACADGLVDALPPARNTVVVAGCEAHVCVLQTAFGLLRSGRKVTVVSDAVGSRRTFDRDAGIARLGAAGVQIATVEMLGFEWLGSSRHPRFRDVLRLIK